MLLRNATTLMLLGLLGTTAAADEKIVYYRQSEYNVHKMLVGYYPVDEKTALALKEGAYRYKLAEDGHPIDVAFLREGKPSATAEGFYRIAIEGRADDPQAKMWKHTYFGQADQKIGEIVFILGSSHKNGVTDRLLIAQGPDNLKSFDIDAQHRVLSDSEYHIDGHVVHNTFKFNEQDMIVEVRYVNEKGEPAVPKPGHWSRKQIERDACNNIIDARVFDTANKPMEYQGAFHSTYKFDNKGEKIEEKHFKLDGSEAKAP